MQRVNEAMHRELAVLLTRLIPTGEVVMTVTEVRTAPDLRKARVMLSFVGGNPLDYEHLFRTVKARRAELQHLLSRRVILKFTPQLEFLMDETGEKAVRLTQILDDLEKGIPAPPAEP
jgi:ribosome-binding factor A